MAAALTGAGAGHDMGVHAGAGKPVLLAQGGEGGEGGEGRVPAGGSGGYLVSLGLIEGHLRAGMAVAAAGGDTANAWTHMRHPEVEIYPDLAPELEARGAAGFEPELEALAATTERGGAEAALDAGFAAVLGRLEAARAAEAGGAAARLKALPDLVRVAATEYGNGIVDGEIVDLHEYQDAWGFVQAALAELDRLAASPDAGIAAAAVEMRAALVPGEAVFAGVLPEGPVEGDSSLLWGAAARMELVAARLD